MSSKAIVIKIDYIGDEFWYIARKLIGFKPVTSFEVEIRNTIKWYKVVTGKWMGR